MPDRVRYPRREQGPRDDAAGPGDARPGFAVLPGPGLPGPTPLPELTEAAGHVADARDLGGSDRDPLLRPPCRAPPRERSRSRASRRGRWDRPHREQDSACMGSVGRRRTCPPGGPSIVRTIRSRVPWSRRLNLWPGLVVSDGIAASDHGPRTRGDGVLVTRSRHHRRAYPTIESWLRRPRGSSPVGQPNLHARIGRFTLGSAPWDCATARNGAQEVAPGGGSQGGPGARWLPAVAPGDDV